MKAEVWSKDNCSYCEQAKKLLSSKNIEYVEKKIGYGYTREDLLAVVPTARSVPQIFIDGNYVGGFEQLTKHLSDVAA